MRYLLLALDWLLSVIFGLLATSMILTGNVLPSVLFICAFFLVFPPARIMVLRFTGRVFRGIIRVPLALILAFGGMYALASGAANQSSIYATPEVQARFVEMYDARLAEWPVPYEEQFISTSVGRVHVITSGPHDAQPMVLLNAAGLAGWSWMYNIVAFSRCHRTYAIDTMGEVGKSELADVDVFPRNPEELAAFQSEILDSLGIERADFVGASFGGFIATSTAIHAPERVRSLSLLGPMGLTPSTGKSVAMITFAALFPVKPVQNYTLTWALGESPVVHERYDEWFRLVMEAVMPKEATPRAFTPEELARVSAPTLLVLGSRDNLTGDPVAASALASNIPGIRIEVIDAAHAMGVEVPATVDSLVTGFIYGLEEDEHESAQPAL